jgi:hypothetical protein
MARLYRPAVPVEVECRVLLRQLGEMWPDKVIKERRWRPGDSDLKGLGVFIPRGLGALRDELKERLAELLNCKIEELRLDHDPPLGARPKTGEGKRTRYTPDANDCEYLFFRPHGTQHANSHDTKTRIRGDRGQYSDIALIKRERRRQRREKPTAHDKKVARFKDWKRKRDKALRLKIKQERKKRCRK